MKGIILLICGMILFGSATPFSKIIGKELPVFTASTARVLLGSLALLPFAWKHLNTVKDLKFKQWIFILSISLFGIVGFTASLMKGMSFISGVSGSIVMALVPIVTAIGARIFLKSKFTKLQVLAAYLAFSGATSLYIFRESFQLQGDNYVLGLALVFVAVLCEAAYTLLGKLSIRETPPLLVTFLAACCAIPIFLLLSFTEGNPIELVSGMKLNTLLSLLWWGIGTMALGSACWYKGVEKAEGGTIPAFMGLMPLSALILSYWLLNEPFKQIHLLGFGLVFAGVLLMSKAHMKMMKKHQ